MNTHAAHRWLVFALLLAAAFAPPAAGRAQAEDADACPNRRNVVTIKPMNETEQQLHVIERMGPPPRLSADERAKIDAGQVVVREQADQGGARKAIGIAVIKAPPASVMVFLRQVDRHAGVMPHLKKQTVRWDGNVALLESWLDFSIKSVHYQVRVGHYLDSLIEWEYVCGDVADTTGYWKLYPEKDEQHTLAVYHVRTDPGIPMPDFLIRMLTASSMPSVMLKVRDVVTKKR